MGHITVYEMSCDGVLAAPRSFDWCVYDLFVRVMSAIIASLFMTVHDYALFCLLY